MPHPIRTTINTVLFSDQPTVPATQSERLYLYRASARLRPPAPGSRGIVRSPGTGLEESTFHRMRHHPERLLAGEELPRTCVSTTRRSLRRCLTTDLLLTMSSTACLEALDHGRRVGLILDLGVHERYGNHVFLDSGLLRTFSQTRTRRDRRAPARVAGRILLRSPDRRGRADRRPGRGAAGHRPAPVAGSLGLGVLRQRGRLLSGQWFANHLVRAHPYGWRALHRRIDRHGPVRGTVRHAIEALVPPVLKRPLLAAARPLARSVAGH